MDFPLDYVRGCFPCLKGSSTVYFDNADAPRSLASVRAFEDNGFDGDAEKLLRDTRESLAYFLNSNAEWAESEILFGPDASELSKRLSLALAKTFGPDKKIVTSDLDDESGLRSWHELEPLGVEIEHWPVKPYNAHLDMSGLDAILTERTRAVVMNKASSSVGSIVELLPLALGVQNHPSALVINWSAFLPHGSADVRFLRSDFLIASTRLFFGAKLGFLWGARKQMDRLREEAPEMFEGLTVAPSALAGLDQALRYVEELGLVTQEMQLQPSEDYGRRRHMRRGMQAIRHYERSLTALLLRRLAEVPGVTVYGIRDENAAAHRMPHILFQLQGYEPEALAEAFSAHGVRVGCGNGDAPRLMRSLGLPEDRGAVCVSLLHYNSAPEIERFAQALHELAYR